MYFKHSNNQLDKKLPKVIFTADLLLILALLLSLAGGYFLYRNFYSFEIKLPFSYLTLQNILIANIILIFLNVLIFELVATFTRKIYAFRLVISIAVWLVMIFFSIVFIFGSGGGSREFVLFILFATPFVYILEHILHMWRASKVIVSK
jgi:hypothetical protein